METLMTIWFAVALPLIALFVLIGNIFANMALNGKNKRKTIDKKGLDICIKIAPYVALFGFLYFIIILIVGFNG